MYVDTNLIAEPIALNAWSTGKTIFIELTDGRTISFPAGRFKNLAKATEEQLKESGAKYKAGSFPFKASGRARASNDSDGFIKVLADADTDEILGVHMIGPRAADMIAEAVVAMEFRASAEDIARISHAHPTYTEAFREASMAATENRAIHI